MKTNSIALVELCLFLEQLLETKRFSDFCINGLQLEGKTTINKLGLAVTASLEVIEGGIKAGVDALLVHHGLFWNNDPRQIIGIKREKAAKLLKHQISLLAYHLPLDAHRLFGNNWKAAYELGWDHLEPFGLSQGEFIGVKGTFSPKKREQFKQELEIYYQHPAVVAMGGKKLVSSAALVSGGAYRLLGAAAKEKVDCFITGNFDEPAWDEAHEEKMNFFALGHHASERIGPQALGRYLADRFNIETIFIDASNPF